MEEYKYLEIPMKEIASNTFDEKNYLGGGAFGKVYKGELSRFKERGLVAFKKLDRRYGQGEPEFLKEISLLSKYKHKNVITLLGYCWEGEELILVYEYASKGSLDSHLSSPDLNWTRRLKICLQAAKGIRYLHAPKRGHVRVFHRDIKSANILLDDKWNAKVSDFGLSKLSPVKVNLVTNATGTHGYTDPQYNYTLTEKFDVYSFGVTLFEVLCGRLCYKEIGLNEVNVYVQNWKKSYKNKKLQDIIKLNKDQMDQTSLEVFSDIAYKCVKKSPEKRPSMAEVVTELGAALRAQKHYNSILQIQQPKKYAEIVRDPVFYPIYSPIEQLKERVSEEILITRGKAESIRASMESCRQTMQESNIHSNLGGPSQKYEEVCTNNYARSQESQAAYTYNYVRPQRYEPTHSRNDMRSQQYETSHNSNNVRSQEYKATFNNNNGGPQECGATYNRADYTNFSDMYDQPNINLGVESQDPHSTMSLAFSQFNLGQSSQLGMARKPKPNRKTQNPY